MSTAAGRTVVVAECDGNRPTRVSFEAIAAATQLGAPITVVMVGGPDMAAGAEPLLRLDIDQVVCLQHEALGSYTPDGFAMALAAFIRDMQPGHVVFPHTYRTRDLVPALASRLDRAVITDCTRVSIVDGRAVLTRPMFRGKVEADVEFEGPPPYLMSVQVGAFSADAVPPGSTVTPRVEARAATVDPAAIRQIVEPPFREARQRVDLESAERIVAVGRGIKSQEHLALAERLAVALDAELAASRPICDSGWLPPDRQVGSSGQTVAPALYVALGISGAIQHVVGMKGARTVVAINTDREAPIFEIAHYGIVGDLFDVVPALVTVLEGGG
jgi:electron transfer flavoprotein alpha subunit